jgi:hypothetical protein
MQVGTKNPGWSGRPTDRQPPVDVKRMTGARERNPVSAREDPPAVIGQRHIHWLDRKATVWIDHDGQRMREADIAL